MEKQIDKYKFGQHVYGDKNYIKNTRNKETAGRIVFIPSIGIVGLANKEAHVSDKEYGMFFLLFRKFQ